MGGIVDTVTESAVGFVGDITGATAMGEAGAQAGRLGAEAAQAAEQGIQQRFEATQEMIRPQVEAGDLAREQQLQLLGLRGAEAQQQVMSQLQESPAQKFLRERGQRELLRNAAAIGGLGGGNVREALLQRGIGFAQQDIQNQFARLGGLSGSGAAATGRIGQLGAGAAQQAGQFGMQAAQQRGAALMAPAQARQAAFGQALQIGGMVGGAMAGMPPTGSASLF